jgi:heme/copper-type cytochrome/quinol oxidase subunit 2
VITDQWRAYEAACRHITGMEHRTMNNSINFVNPNDFGTHTQQIEGFWSLSKWDIRSRQGTRQDEHYEYLLQFIWAHQISNT